jgi:hypothetical protein
MSTCFERLSLGGCVVLVLSLASPVFAQSAYFSLQGAVNVVGDQHDLFMDLSRSVGSAEDLRFVTYTHTGGTNAAGDVIAASGFITDLSLFDGGGNLRGQDIISGPGSDALLSWAGVQTGGTPLNPDPLPADNYRLNLQEFGNNATGNWALDLIGPADALTFTGGAPTGTSTLDSLKFGTTGGGTATYNQSSGTFDLLGQLVVANTGSAGLNLSGGTITVNGTTTVNAGGVLNLSGTGQINLLGDTTLSSSSALTQDGGTVVVDGSTFLFNGSYSFGGTTTSSTFNVINGGEALVAFSWNMASAAGTTASTTVSGVNLGVPSTLRATGGGGGADMQVGSNGNATLNVLDGGRVIAGDDLFVGSNTGSNGLMVINGIEAVSTLRSTVSVNRNNSVNSNIYVGGGQGSTAGTGQLRVENGGLAETSGSLFIGQNVGSNGTVFVGGADLVTSTDAQFTIGQGINIGGTASTTGGTGLLEIAADGIVSAGATVKVWPNGELRLGEASSQISAPTLDVEGGLLNMNFNGGNLPFPNVPIININTGGQWTIDGTATGNVNIQQNNTINLDGNGTLLDFTGKRFRVRGGSVMNVTGGADALIRTNFDIGDSGDGTLLVSGPGSSVVADPDAEQMWWGRGSSSALVTFSNGATGSFLAGVELNNISNGNSQITVNSSAALTLGDLDVAAIGGSGTAVVDVDGPGSDLTIAGSSYLLVGQNSGVSSATISVSNSAIINTGTGNLTLNSTGTINLLSSGVFNANGNTTLAGGTLNLNGGTLNSNGTTTIASGTANILPGGLFNNIGGLTLTGGTLNLNGGTLSLADASPLINSTGTFIFNSGTLELRNAVTLDSTALGATLGGNSIGTGQELRTLGTTTLPAGVTLDVAGGTLTTTGLILLPGSSLQALAPSTVSTGTLLASTATTIDATGSDMTLGNASAVNGFASAGTTNVGNNTITLLDANDAVFDSLSLVTLGDGLGGAGTLAAANGLTLNFGGNIAGFGTVNTPNDPFKPLINNGNITGDSALEPITLTGYVKGVGTLDNVVITGTDAPGFSPASVFRGSVRYAGTLQVEIGGLSTGSFDIINHSGTATLGGVLDLSLINGFVPGIGDTFQFMTAGSRAGEFNSIVGADLGGGLLFDVIYGTNDVTLQVISSLLAGDLNADGFVGIADLNIVLGNWNQNVPPANPLADPSGDGFVGIADLNEVLGNWNAGVPPLSGDSASIPEPGAVALVGLGLVLLLGQRRLAAN